MPPVLEVFYQTVIPVVGIALMGYLFARKFHPDSGTLSRSSYYFFIPAFIFHTISTGENLNEKIIAIIPAVLVIQLVITFCAVMISKMMKNSQELTSAYVISAAFPNIGNFALPLLIFRFGDGILETATLLFLIILIHSFVISVFFAGRGVNIKKGLISVFKTPAILAFFVAILFPSMGLSLPVPVSRITGLMGQAMIPVMLFTIGAQIAEIKSFSFNRHIFVMVFTRLFLAPFIAFLLLPFFSLSKDFHQTALIDFAMPTALLANIIATEYDIKPKLITMVVFFSTLGSVFTLTIFLTFF